MNKIFFLLPALLFLFPNTSKAEAAGKNLPLVFDPQTKKYFIGGHSKFSLRPGEQSGLIDRIELSVDGGEYRPYDQSIEFKSEGKHTLKFRAINPVNNWSPVQYLEVFVDMTPPTTKATFDDEHSYKNDSTIYLALHSKITLAAQDNLSGISNIEYSWDGRNFSTYAKPVEVEQPGHQTLYYRSVDKVGNEEKPKKVEFIADGTPPTSDLKFGGTGKPTVINGTTYVSDGVAFEVSASDDGSKVKQIWVSLDGSLQPYIKPIYFLQEGQHKISYYSEDNVGNKEPAKSLTVYTVSIPPRTVVVPMAKTVDMGGINYANVGFQLKLVAHDNAVGLDHIEYKLDDGSFRQYIEPLTFRGAGLHSLTYRSVDRTGNVEPAKTYAISVVDKVPETTLSTAQPLITREGVTYSPAPNVITLNVASGSGVGIEQTLVSVNDGPFKPYSGPIALNNQTKQYKIAYKSVDRLGNEEPMKTALFHMLRTMPMVDLFISNGQSAEEQVRTNYLDQGSAGSGDTRAPSSDAGKHSKKSH